MIRREQPVTILRSESLIVGEVPASSPATVEENDNGEHEQSGNDSGDGESEELVRTGFRRRSTG